MPKSTFFTGQPIFTQLLSLIPRTVVDGLSEKHDANRYCKRFMAYDHLVVMLYSCFFKCTSLREITTGILANSNRLRHLGLKASPARSTLSDANARRSEKFFADLYHELYRLHFLPDSRSSKKSDRLYIMDSTTISLFSNVMVGAGTVGSNGRKKGGAKAHMIIDAKHDLPMFVHLTEARHNDRIILDKIDLPAGSTIVFDKGYILHKKFNEWNVRGVRWVTRMRADAHLTSIEHLPVSADAAQSGVLSDKIARMGRPSNAHVSETVMVRMVEYHDKLSERVFQFISNDTQCSPQEIAWIYKSRWQIESLFKRIKQSYPLRYFMGDNPNAIKIQIWCALICDLLVRLIHRQVNKLRAKPWSYANICSMIRHHLMSYLNLIQFLINPDKVQQEMKNANSSQLLLFD